MFLHVLCFLPNAHVQDIVFTGPLSKKHLWEAKVAYWTGMKNMFYWIIALFCLLVRYRRCVHDRPDMLIVTDGKTKARDWTKHIGQSRKIGPICWKMCWFKKKVTCAHYPDFKNQKHMRHKPNFQKKGCFAKMQLPRDRSHWRTGSQFEELTVPNVRTNGS